jgi:hypothetical protein
MEDGWTDSKVLVHLPTMDCFFIIQVIRNAAHCGHRNVGSDGRTVGQMDGLFLLPLYILQLRRSDGVYHASLFLN